MNNEYDEITVKNENPLLKILKWTLSIILVVLLIILIIWLVKGTSKNNNNGLDPLLNRIFTDNINVMKDAAKDYYSVDKVPQKEGETYKLTLKEMIDLKLLLSLTDKYGDTCDVNKSYTEITKVGDKYMLKVNLSCGNEEDYIIVYLGCYNFCKNYVCEVEDEDKEEVVISNPSCTLKVVKGTGSNGKYTSDVVIGFASKKASTGASITDYGVGLKVNYEDSIYTVKSYGKTKVYGYVKDSNGKTAVCNITVEKVKQTPVEVGSPSCSLKVVSGTLNSNGTYKSDIVIGFDKVNAGKNATLKGSGVGITTNYTNKTFTVTDEGTTKVYGYVKNSSGKTATCSIEVTKETKVVRYEYLYEKEFDNEYSEWSDWSENKVYTENDNITWGQQELVWNEKNGAKKITKTTYEVDKNSPIWQVKYVKIGTYNDYVCDGYTYFRDGSTSTTYETTEFVYSHKLTNVSSIPNDTATTKYEFKGINYAVCKNTCTSKPVYIVDVYTRKVTAKTETEGELSAKCNVKTVSIPVYGTKSTLIGYNKNQIETITYEYYYHTKTRTLIKEAYTSQIWSTNENDKYLINQGYKYTGVKREI